MKRAKAFISYSHADESFVERFRVHCKPLEREYNFIIWDDTRINPGEKWKLKIEKELEDADVIVMFLSADFLASDFVMQKEYQNALKLNRKHEIQIIVLFVSPCAYEDFEIADYQFINSPDNTLLASQTDVIQVGAEIIYVKAVKQLKAYLEEAEEKRKSGKGSG